MMTKILKWGQSCGLRLTDEVLFRAQIEVGDNVMVSVRNGRIIIEPRTKARGRYELKELVAKIPKDYAVEEFEWGPTSGKEAW